MHEAVEKVQGMRTKLMELVLDERIRPEKEPQDLLPTFLLSETKIEDFEEE